MRLEEILPNIDTDLLLKVTTPDGKSYVLLYALAQKPIVLPSAHVVADRWQNIANLSRSAFGCLDCSIVSLNGKMIIHAQARHISWSQGSVPFIFVEEGSAKAASLRVAALTSAK
jgi:hypothetical protein